MGIFEKIMVAGLAKFKDGSIVIIGNRVVMPPASTFSEYSLAINDSPEYIYLLYNSIKNSFKQMVETTFTKKYGFGFNDFVKWMTNIGMLTGWGLFSVTDVDKDKKTGIIWLENSPVATMVVGRAKTPCDHVIRAYWAAVCCTAFKEDMDVFEEECVALGAAKCKLRFKPRKEFPSNAETKRQLGLGLKSG